VRILLIVTLKGILRLRPFMYPLVDDSIEIDINPADIEILLPVLVVLEGKM
jgi:hypothetical protein